jgi:hypothetical protein
LGGLAAYNSRVSCPPKGARQIQFTLKTLLLLFVVLWTSLASFWVFGIPITVVCVLVGLWFRNPRWKYLAYFTIFVLIGVTIIALLLPCVSRAREAARQAGCRLNFKEIGLALHNYHDDHGCFPPAYVADKNGRPMHSWRTLILPYLEENTIYRAYDFNEPWDGPNNQKLANTHIAAFRCPSSEHWQTPTPRSDYGVVTGPGTVWPGEKGMRIKDITDGISNTILLVEITDSDIHWMEPRDVTLEEALGKPGDGVATAPTSNHYTKDSYFFKSLPVAGHIAMADGSVWLLHKRPTSEDFAAITTIDGGEPVNIESLVEKCKYPLSQQLRWDHVIGLLLFLISLVWFWFQLFQDSVKLKARP